MNPTSCYKTSEFSNLLWKQIYNELKRRIDPAIFNSWFRNIQFVGINKNKLELAVSSKFIKEWLANNYLALIQKVTRCFKPEIIEVSIKVKSTRSSKQSANSNFISLASNIEESKEAANAISSINPLFNFENFVIGDFNRIAYQSARHILEGKASFSGHNILFVHSKVGMGKTHLLQATITEAKQKNLKALYYSAEKFANQYVFACQNNTLNNFKAHNRSCDIFIVDDIQFLTGKVSTMQELTNTIIALVEARKTVVIACDSSPFSLKVDKRLSSRFNGGIVTEIQAPNYKNRLEILKHKLKVAKVELDLEIIEYIAKNISNSVRELEGALYKVLNYKNMLNETVDLKATKKILQENVNALSQSITFDKILESVSNYFSVSQQDITSKSRLKKYVYPRQIVSLLAKQLTRDSLQEIGNKLGGKDHATVIYSITKLEEKLQSDEKTKNDVSSLMKIICN